ncbi:hypothetical protein PVK06_002655 [Gossypium arboreum]|uniref:Retrovirus-related Pol polyprotein from transposon TNT 1-94 n=1 Tax=Gossypium arboreum TaxID=29729 RepID=A0ABR0R460_GOSAR|nr:hypothetical protein PVK06_002655 [Gossypium arboreum]
MSRLSSPFAVHSNTQAMASFFTDGVVDARFFSIKKVSVLLDDHNYLLWRQQVLLVIKTYKIQGFLDPCTVPPLLLLPNTDGVLQANPEFAQFEQQDSALASRLLSSVSQTVLPHLIGKDTSAHIWGTIVTLYGSKTTSRLMFYHRALHFQRKGDLLMRDFLLKIKGFCDNLAICGEVISDHEHVTAILNGLPPEYESMITSRLAKCHTMLSCVGSRVILLIAATIVSILLVKVQVTDLLPLCKLIYAFISIPETVSDNAWYPDSGATHHLTHLATSMGDNTSHNGPGKVYVGNCTVLPVLSTGQSSLLNRTRPLYMRYLLLCLE